MVLKNSASDIVVLSGLEAVRKNPWMYVGSVSDAGAHQLLFELIYNSVDEIHAGGGSRVSVTLAGRSARVEDDGRGLPTEVHPREGVPAAEVALTRLHSGSKFSRKADRFSAGLHGLGLSCVNALSARLAVDIRRNGRAYRQEFRRGNAVRPLKDIGRTAGRGTAIEFRPDPGIFKEFTGFDRNVCRRFLKDLSYLNPDIEFRFVQKGKPPEVYRTKAGIAGLLARLSERSRPLIPKPLRIQLNTPSLAFHAVLHWTTGTDSVVRSFVNGVDTVLGGSHVSALRSGLTRAVNSFASRMRTEIDTIEADEVTEGLIAVIDLKLAHPSFEGQTKTRLTNADIVAPVENATARQALEFCRKNPRAGSAILDRILQARNARTAARRAAEKVYFQGLGGGVDEDVYRAQFGARSRNWHESAAWITDRELLRAHAEFCRQGKGAVALDVCCGSGVVGAAFKGRVKKVVGLDLTPEMIEMARTRLDEVRKGTVYNLPFKTASFDLVCTREVLHLLPYPERPVSEIFRVLKPGGQFIVGQTLPFSEDDAAWMFRIFKKKQPLIFNWFQEQDFKRLLMDGGFVDVEMKERRVWESIDVWIDSPETTGLHRHEIRRLYREAPSEAKAVHPFEILPSGKIRDLWRWGIFSARKPIA
jgi:DNA gyrase subunit B